MEQIKGIVFKNDIKAPWIKELESKDGKIKLNVGSMYSKGTLTKITAEKLDDESPDILFCDLVFDNGTVFRVGGMKVDTLV